jgi:hypothetical protein
MKGRPAVHGPPRTPVGNREARAAWLRSWLASGHLTCSEAATALDVPPDAIEDIAAGKVALANPSWQKLAALVATKVH